MVLESPLTMMSPLTSIAGSMVTHSFLPAEPFMLLERGRRWKRERDGKEGEEEEGEGNTIRYY